MLTLASLHKKYFWPLLVLTLSFWGLPHRQYWNCLHVQYGLKNYPPTGLLIILIISLRYNGSLAGLCEK